MAIAKEKWELAKALFELGKSLQEIENETEIKRSSISKKAKIQQWEKAKNQQLKSEIVDFEKKKSTLEQEKSTLVEKVSKLSDFEITLIDGIVENEIHHKSMFFNNMNLAMIRSNQQLTSNTKEVAIKTKESFGGGAGSETIHRINLELDSADLRNHVELTHKAGVALGIVSDKPEIAIQNNQITNQIEDEIIITKKGH